jgi:phage terminase small subunit
MAQRGRKSAASLATHLVVVVPEPAPVRRPPAPGHLSPAMREWWDQVMVDFELDRHHLRLLEAACDAWDRMVGARSAIAEHGLTFSGKGGDPKPRPEVAVERDARLAFARLLRELDLDTIAVPEVPRPPSLRSNRR